MTTYTLLISIVPHDCGELITGAAVKAGAGGGTILMGRGTASSKILQVLGLGDTSKDIVNILVSDDKKEEIKAAVTAAAAEKRQHFGILFSLQTTAFIKAGQTAGGEKSMNDSATHQMITVIVNKGYADDVMAAARNAGAGGGTIVNARGTAKEDDARFFGMQIVPEKEMLLIIIPSEKAQAVLDAVKNLACLSQPGSGIAYSAPAGDFTLLGKKQ